MYSNLRFDKEFRRAKYRLLESGSFEVNRAGKLVHHSVSGAWTNPWIFVAPARRKFCGLWNSIYNGIFGVIPTHCRFNCWKTVPKPRNVKELFQLYELLRALNLPSKLGMDVRTWTYGPWAAFIYGDTIEQGKEYFDRVSRGLKALGLEGMPIILKRGCTEMEQRVPSSEWDNVPVKELERQRELDDMFEFEEMNYFQSDWLKRDIMERWIEHAIEIGDPTAREVLEAFTDEPDIWSRLVSQPDTYHNADPRKQRKRNKQGRFTKKGGK